MANINVRIDLETKIKAERVFEKLGLTPTTAICLFYRQVIRTNSIPFELIAEIPNDETKKAIEEIEAMENGQLESETFESVDEILENLSK